MSKRTRLCALLAVCAAAVQAVDWKALEPQGYLSDFAGVADEASRAKLERYCAAVERSTGAQIALVTIPTLHGEPIEDVANTIFRAWGVGQRGSNEGALLLLVTGERRSRLEVGYGLEPHIPDGFAGSVLREMRPALRAGQYGEALLAAAQTIGERVAQAKGVSIDATVERRIPREESPSVPWPLILGGFAILLFLLGAGGRGRRAYHGPDIGGVLPGMILGGMLGRGMGRSTWGGRGSGGFGGFDSGDSFGGFGGGDSGGGGASSDW